MWRWISRRVWQKQAAWVTAALVLGSTSLHAERLAGNQWQLLAVAYPDGREVETILGGAERTLTAKGLAKIKWQENAATVELKLEDLPAPAEAGWSGTQYVLWAADNENRVLNLGPVPLNGNKAEWRLQVPFRIFGLLVTAEKDSQASAPSSGVVLESRLPTNPNLVLPVFRVKLSLTP